MGKLKILLSCLITICITIAMLSYCGHLLDPDESETAMDAIKAFHMLEDNCSLVVRPSGTEPKLKLYISVSAESREAAKQIESGIKDGADAFLQ